MTTGQNNSRVVRNIDPVLTEVLCRDSFDMDEGPEIDFQVVLLRQIMVGRFIRLRLRLCNEYGFYFQGTRMRWGNFQTVFRFAALRGRLPSR